MNEAETRAELIDPALKEAGWGVVDRSRILRERNCQISQGRLLGAGKRAKPEIADYILVHRNRKLAVIEAKKRDLPITQGVGQAKQYASKLQTRFAYSTNGIGIYRIDMHTGQECEIDTFPTPEELWAATFSTECDWRDRFASIPFEDKGGAWQPRYYQDIAITRALDAVAGGKDRILLTLATGTGKTAIAFQIAWKLFHAKWNSSREPTRRPRILFLADRNILADQAFNAFNAFEEDALVRIDPSSIRKKGKVPKNGSVFFTIFQTFTAGFDYETDKPKPNFGDYPEDFFDFIIIDECHRGGAKDESSWRDILEYFSAATQLGLTATPLRKHNADTYRYFGEPVYTYALKDGINDGFLTPFKVHQITTTLDDYVYTSDDDIIEGDVTVGKVYEEADFNRVIEIKEREKKRVEIFLNSIDQREKSIVFCATQLHALAVRDLINQLKTSTEPNYCARVTADDGALGEQHLKQFQDNEKTIPTILTTSQKLSTGVDARNVRHIVLMRPVNSMIEFKQIVGRGTRLYDGKDYFTIHDFVKAYRHFADPEWDGEPLEPEEPRPVTPREPCKACGNRPCTCEKPPTEPCSECGELDCICGKQSILKIKLADGKERRIKHLVQTSFWDADGKPLSSREFLIKLYGEIPEFFKDEQELRTLWSHPNTRLKLLEGLAEKGYGIVQLKELAKLIEAENSDIYDVLVHIAYAREPLTREQRVEDHADLIHSHYTDKQQAFIDYILSSYIQNGTEELEPSKLPSFINIKYGSVHDAMSELGDAAAIKSLFDSFQQHLYEETDDGTQATA
ncbi:type I restriction enzyme, R subunit [Rubritalea squalenifaciens DSM 18772]|uniref:Type I restriction enzyme, R subunit n=1 Tax=Rubritalea squalenifaciens DSM 18772 TaxID=1123071 RepID=A0A1M6GSU2_9BACT|nr:type I restriction endonuclease subunit R [Rubritalea squalenifaciens]SHJ12982.1 type I restriction enzyme, R subunit [Rubritalea squalenifaciens DSM 18772]